MLIKKLIFNFMEKTNLETKELINLIKILTK